MNKGADVKNDNDNKAHARKGKSLVQFNTKKYFSNLSENSKFTFYRQNQFFVLQDVRWNCGSSSCTAKV